MALMYMKQSFKTSNFIGHHLYVTALLFLGLFNLFSYLFYPVSSWYPKLKAKLLPFCPDFKFPENHAPHSGEKGAEEGTLNEDQDALENGTGIDK